MTSSIDGVGGGSAVAEYTPAFPQTTAASKDTAVLSVTAQARLLEQRGLTISEIADELGITTTAVQSYLSIATTVSLTKSASA